MRIESNKDLIEIFRKAKKAGLAASLIHDAGKTQIPEGSATAVAIGPERDEKIDTLVGNLKLY